MKQALPYLLTILIFSLVLLLSKPSYDFINTHDEDDNLVSGYLMATRDYQLNSDIFSHHLPGAYLISEQLERSFLPKSTSETVFLHRSFVTLWNLAWATLMLSIFGSKFLWLMVTTELLRAGYLYSLFQAENLVIYPAIYLMLSLLIKHRYQPIVLGLASGIVVVLLSPLWPLVLISGGYFAWMNRKSYQDLLTCFAASIVPIIVVATKIDIGEFYKQFFGYNALTYAPMVMKKPILYTLAAFLAPGISLLDLSLTPKIIMIQILVLFLFVFEIKRVGFKKWILFGILLGVVGFRRTPRLHNEGIDFHVLPWVICLATFCWYKYFYNKLKITKTWLTVLVSPFLILFLSPKTFFPDAYSAGKMVIRYQDDSEIVSYLKQIKEDQDTLFSLPAHTLLYRQTGIKPFNKFLFYLPWMEQSPILFEKLSKTFELSLPSFVFIDSVNFPYTPPELIKKILNNYDEYRIIPNQPPIYILKSRIK